MHLKQFPSHFGLAKQTHRFQEILKKTVKLQIASVILCYNLHFQRLYLPQDTFIPVVNTISRTLFTTRQIYNCGKYHFKRLYLPSDKFYNCGKYHFKDSIYHQTNFITVVNGSYI